MPRKETTPPGDLIHPQFYNLVYQSLTASFFYAGNLFN